MDVIEAIQSRKSVKKYLDRPVPDQLLGGLVEAGSMAPSSGNKQNWKFIVVKNDDTREQIAKHCDEQYWMTKAPAHIVVCSDDAEIMKFYGERGMRMYSPLNCAAAVENMLLMAHSLGLGACWVSEFDDQELANDLGLSSGSRVQAVVTIGFPTKELRKKTLKPLKDIMYLESFGNKVKSFAPFVYDWSTVMKENVEAVKKDLTAVLGTELASASKNVKKKISLLSKKIVDRLRQN
jgi:nitroreductase